MKNLCDVDLMSFDVASLTFQAHAKYGTWSIDFGANAPYAPSMYHYLTTYKFKIWFKTLL